MEEWEKQVKAQTKPLARQSPNNAKKVVLDIIALTGLVEGLEEKIEELSESMMGGDVDVDDLFDEMNEVRAQVQVGRKALAKKKKALSVGDRKHWDALKDNKFLAMRMNVLALKERLRDQVRMRRFEIDALKRHESKQKKDSHKLTQHAKAHINCREPSSYQLQRTNYQESSEEVQCRSRKDGKDDQEKEGYSKGSNCARNDQSRRDLGFGCGLQYMG